MIFDSLLAIPKDKLAKIKFPLLSDSICDQLFVTVDESVSSDYKLFRLIVSGQSIKTIHVDEGRSDQTKENSLERILQKISAINLTKKFTIPIDSARASYVLASIIVHLDEFDKILISFYSHLLSSLGRICSDSEPDALAAEAYELLSRAYANKGGIKAAKIEVTNGVNGGRRHIFDVMVEQLKYDEKEAYVNYVLKTEIDPLDWDTRVDLMKCFLSKLGDNLPEEITSEPPERYVSSWEIIVKSYVQSIEQMKLVLRMF